MSIGTVGQAVRLVDTRNMSNDQWKQERRPRAEEAQTIVSQIAPEIGLTDTWQGDGTGDGTDVSRSRCSTTSKTKMPLLAAAASETASQSMRLGPIIADGGAGRKAQRS